MPDAEPEAIMGHTVQYIQGLADGLSRTAPDLTEHLAEEVKSTLCATNSRPSQQLTMIRLLMAMPTVASEEGFDCIANRGVEDPVLWNALDAWKASGLPKTEALLRLEQNASDPRTKARFKDRGHASEATEVPEES